jgi:hypothetical protein
MCIVPIASRPINPSRGDIVDAFNPKVRDQAVKVEEFQGELLVYDLTRHGAHCLNGAAVSVWRLADGTRSVTEIAQKIGAETSAEPDEALVWRALEELDTASLLATPLPTESVDADRRRMLTRLGWAAAIPLVLSITVPKPAFAQSLGPTGALGAD